MVETGSPAIQLPGSSQAVSAAIQAEGLLSGTDLNEEEREGLKEIAIIKDMFEELPQETREAMATKLEEIRNEKVAREQDLDLDDWDTDDWGDEEEFDNEQKLDVSGTDDKEDIIPHIDEPSEDAQLVAAEKDTDMNDSVATEDIEEGLPTEDIDTPEEDAGADNIETPDTDDLSGVETDDIAGDDIMSDIDLATDETINDIKNELDSSDKADKADKDEKSDVDSGTDNDPSSKVD